MTSLFNSLTEISTGYSVFEKDQVLTEAQLNSVSEYLDDQDRLNRVNLIGVGIVCGLRVSLATSAVSLGKGLGITTDGDLLRIASDTSYNRFKLYDNQFPKYPPLYVDAETMLPAYELVEPGTADPLAKNLSQFGSVSGLVLADMVALLLVESYIKDHDLCTGADCDNHSKDYISKARLILVEKSSVSALLPPIQTADNAARALDHLASDHVAVSAAITSATLLADQFRAACSSMHGRLTTAFPKLWTQASFLLGDHFPGNPAPSWVTRLNAINSGFSGSDTRIQYYFDFLRDLIDTWNQMRDLLFGENAWCCPDINGFPKHLMLGNLTPGADINENRLAFYAAAAINRDSRLQEAIFLAKKLDLMISEFSLPAVQNSASAIRVTPSCSSKQDLQKRAIPYYFPHAPANPVHEKWSFRLSQRDMNRYNFSYHAGSYSAQGGAADPLASAFDHNDFFRVEGHQGQQATTVLTALDDLIESNNLPFSVCGLLLGTAIGDVVDRKGAGYTDLNRLHYLLRQDVVRKLDEVKTFSGNYTNLVHKAVSDYGIGDVAWSTQGLTGTANSRNNSITSNSDDAITWLSQDYQQYRGNSAWLTNIGLTMSEVGKYKADFDKVSTTSYPTSFDSWVDYFIVNWIPWLDRIIEDKDDKADTRKLFREFIADHPGLEHTGGVIRGGTFVIVYDAAGIVVADFMLSHYYKEAVEPPSAEPPLNKPNIPRDDVAVGGISFHPTLDTLFDKRLFDFKLEIDNEWLPKFDTQIAYQDLFQNFVGIYAGATGPVVNPGVGGDGGGLTYPGQAYDDPILGAATDRVVQETELIRVLGEKLDDTTLPASERGFYEAERTRAQENLAKDMEVVAIQMDKSNTDISVGAEGRTSMEVMSKGMEILADNPTALNNSRAAMETVGSGTENSGLAEGLGLIIAGNFTL